MAVHPRIRPALRADVPRLAELERRCFSTDRLSPRSLQRMAGSETASLLVAEDGDRLLGYSLMLFHRGTSLARLYSIALAPEARGLGIAEALLRSGEEIAVERGKVFVRLEVNTANHAAIRLYEKLGYRRFGVYHDYYEDHSDALRMEKRVLYFRHPGLLQPLPYYAQTTEFSCGPAALMMAMAALMPEYPLNRSEELQLWREATTIYMTSGHGGCGPHGLALAAWRRGFDATVYVSQSGPLFLEGVRREEKKAVLEQVHADFIADLAATDVRLIDQSVELDTLRAAINSGRIPIVLISTYRFNRSKAPHWVVVAAIDDRFVYIHDPELDEQENRAALDNQYLPIRLQTFANSMRFGQYLSATVVIGRRETDVSAS